MSQDTDSGSAVASESVASESSSSSESTSAYSVTDPGYESDVQSESEGNDLEALIAENKTETKPSDKPGDASEAEGDTEEETPETESSVEAADNDGVSDELLDRATALGYTIEDIRSFRSAKSLEKDILRSEKLQQRLQERQAGNAPVKEESAPVEEAEPNWAELIEAGHDPDVVNMQQKMWQRAAKAEALVKQVYQAEQDRALTAQTERFDETLNKLDGFEKILGTGRKGELQKASPDQAANRQKVFTKMLVLKRGYEEAGEKVPAEADLIHEAVQASFYKHAQETARTKLKSDIKKAGSQALSRPHSAASKPLSGPTLALHKEQEFWKRIS